MVCIHRVREINHNTLNDYRTNDFQEAETSVGPKMLNKRLGERKQNFIILLVPFMLDKQEYVLPLFLGIESKAKGYKSPKTRKYFD